MADSFEPRAKQALAAMPCGDGGDLSAGAHDPCTHLANAYRLQEYFSDRLLYVQGIGWHTWGPPWKQDELGATRMAQALGRIVASEAAELADWASKARDSTERGPRQKLMDQRFSWARQSESSYCVSASLQMAQPLFACKAEELDANPLLLGLPSGVLELDKGTVRPHDQADRITKIAGCDLGTSDDARVWSEFVAEIMDRDEELIDFVQRLAGYMLSGLRGEHLFPIFWGGGANGKSTLIGVLQAMLGDYASGAGPDLLIRHGGNEHPTAMADLQGKRLVVIPESGEGGRLNEGKAKALTGGDTITARRMRMDFFTFRPTHLLVMHTNHRPMARGTDEGLWRRVRLIPFNVTVPEGKRDVDLPRKLLGELPGVLAWALEGWRKYRLEGFKVPAKVRAATSNYREESDLLAAFLDDVCIVGDTCTAMASDLYKAFVEWSKANGEQPKSQRVFGGSLSERGFLGAKSTGGLMRWRGIGISDGDSGRSEPNLSISSRDSSLSRRDLENRSTSSTNSADAYRRASRGDVP